MKNGKKSTDYVIIIVTFQKKLFDLIVQGSQDNYIVRRDRSADRQR